MSAGSFALMNARTGSVIASDVEMAVTRRTRRKGLLGRDSLAPRSALVLAPCAAVHTMFMRFAIDVIFVDGKGRAAHVVHNLTPWRAAMKIFAHAVVELPAGTLAGRDVAVGDPLYLANDAGNQVAVQATQMRRVLS
jgi:uncharacterized membrane protein (UPF0127 family)